MTQKDVLELGRHGLLVTLELAMPVLLFGLMAGVLVSIFQSVTQIQEFTLTFVPKVLTVAITLAILGPWMLTTMVNYMVSTYSHMPPVIR